MPVCLRALIWALAILGLAVLCRVGLIDDGTAQTVIITLPVLAVISLNAPIRCTDPGVA
jgi:hypothetical protein